MYAYLLLLLLLSHAHIDQSLHDHYVATDNAMLTSSRGSNLLFISFRRREIDRHRFLFCHFLSVAQKYIKEEDVCIYGKGDMKVDKWTEIEPHEVFKNRLPDNPSAKQKGKEDLKKLDPPKGI